MILRRALCLSLPTLFLALACGNSKPPADPAKTPASSDSPASSSPGSDDAKKPPVDKHAAAEAMPHDDPNEKEGPIALDSLVAKGTPKSAFPKASIGDHECLKELPLSGEHRKDYAKIVDSCGAPTGMLPYTKPAEGRLHAKLDKRDHFQLKVFKGMCYRYFAVGDDGIKDIDIVILKKGALMAMDKTDHFVAVIEHDKLWCVDDDMDLDFGVEIDGPGAGGYLFGVWTRPK